MTVPQTLHCVKDIMPAKRQRRSGKRIVRRSKRPKRGQRGGLFPLLALLAPAAIAASKAAALGAVSGAAGYGIKKALAGKKKMKKWSYKSAYFPNAVQDFAKRARTKQRRLKALKKG